MVNLVRCLGGLLLTVCLVQVGQADDAPFAVLAADGKARCVVATGEKPQLMERRAAAELATVISRDSGSRVDVVKFSELSQPASSGLTVILGGTPGSVPASRSPWSERPARARAPSSTSSPGCCR